MKVDNFKELLLKKSEDNRNLQVLIKYMKEEYLVDHIVESLKKMASSYSKKNPNAGLTNFGSTMDEFTEGDMIHDALSHHASAYKAALKAGDKKTADKHMSQIHKIMHMSDKVTKDGLNDHSGGKLRIDAIDPKPWERTGKTNVNDKGKFKTDTVGWKYQRANPDYSHLRGAPHESYKGEIRAHGHNKAYPLEEMKVNDKHIHIDDDHDFNGEYQPHPFDSHPVMGIYNTKPSDHNDLKQEEYLKNVDAFNDEGGGLDAYYDMIEARDPEAHAARGSVKHPGVHEDVPGLNIDRETKEAPAAVSTKVDDLPEKAPSLQDMKAQQKSKLQDILANAKPPKAGK